MLNTRQRGVGWPAVTGPEGGGKAITLSHTVGDAGPTPGGCPVQRVEFSSRSEGEVSEFLRLDGVSNRSRFAPSPDGFRFDTTAVVAAGIAGYHSRSTVTYLGAFEPLDDYWFLTAHGGRMQVDSHLGQTRLARGDVAFYPLGVPLELTYVDPDTTVLRLPASRLERTAEEITGLSGADLRFTGTTPISSGMRDHWRTTAELAHTMLMDQDSPMANPLLAEEMTRTAAVVALHTFPNTTMARQHDPGPGRVAPAALRRAVAYIEANAHRPVTLSDIAAAAGVLPRALQAAFRRHYDTTPMGYLRRVRLEHAHRELQAADPTRGDTVGSIAARWGFAAPGRFARAYR